MVSFSHLPPAFQCFQTKQSFPVSTLRSLNNAPDAVRSGYDEAFLGTLTRDSTFWSRTVLKHFLAKIDYMIRNDRKSSTLVVLGMTMIVFLSLGSIIQQLPVLQTPRPARRAAPRSSQRRSTWSRRGESSARPKRGVLSERTLWNSCNICIQCIHCVCVFFSPDSWKLLGVLTSQRLGCWSPKSLPLPPSLPSFVSLCDLHSGLWFLYLFMCSYVMLALYACYWFMSSSMVPFYSPFFAICVGWCYLGSMPV